MSSGVYGPESMCMSRPVVAFVKSSSSANALYLLIARCDTTGAGGRLVSVETVLVLIELALSPCIPDVLFVEPILPRAFCTSPLLQNSLASAADGAVNLRPFCRTAFMIFSRRWSRSSGVMNTIRESCPFAKRAARFLRRLLLDCGGGTAVIAVDGRFPRPTKATRGWH